MKMMFNKKLHEKDTCTTNAKTDKGYGWLDFGNQNHPEAKEAQAAKERLVHVDYYNLPAYRAENNGFGYDINRTEYDINRTEYEYMVQRVRDIA